jgi:hypothetical protein
MESAVNSATYHTIANKSPDHAKENGTDTGGLFYGRWQMMSNSYP